MMCGLNVNSLCSFFLKVFLFKIYPSRDANDGGGVEPGREERTRHEERERLKARHESRSASEAELSRAERSESESE